MKSIKCLLISLLTLCGATEAYACWGAWYAPAGYYMYRVHDNQPPPIIKVEGHDAEAGKNCVEWQKLTSSAIPLEDIYHVVYQMPLDEFEKIYDTKEGNGNKFIEWIIRNDSPILDFLLLAKSNEYVRIQLNSRWYYPSMKTGARMTIEEIAEKALSVDTPKLRDRYLLQAVRALFSLCRYEECINLWNSEIVHLPKGNLMRKLIQPYIAGAEFHVNNSEKAMTYFAELGDVGSLLYCADHIEEINSDIDVLQLVCEYAPNSKYIEETLQSYVRKLEDPCEYYWEDKYVESYETSKLYALCLKMAKSGRSDNPGMWYYTAAFLSDLKGETNKASYLIGLAEDSKKNDFIAESVKVFRMYIDAKTLTYSSSYESKLFSQLKWLDSKIVNCIDDEVRNETTEGFRLSNGESYYYWNDMLRRILLAEVCPRMIKAGKTTRALQLANMADNRLLGIVDKRLEYTMLGYRYSDKNNIYDYSNHFFEMVDSLGVDTAIKYVQNVRKPVSELDRYLNARGYTGSDYLNDIVGTQCLRNMRYKEAVEYLGAVSEAYKNHLNVHILYNPFSIEKERTNSTTGSKYDFACRMYALEQNINLTSEPNRKARLLIEYAIGLRNSFDRCWGLTQYYRGVGYWGQVCEKRDWENDIYTQTARDKVKQLTQLALDIVTDDELAAEINYTLCNYKTVADKYPNTTKGKLVIGKCDNLRDYHAESLRTIYRRRY